MNKIPLKGPLKLLRLFCNQDYLEEIEGDLLERFEKRITQNKPAKWLLWLDVLKLLRPKIIKPVFGGQKLKQNNMLKHNIIVSFRGFKRHKISFFVNYLGLVGGLVTVLFIYLWVNHELNVDRFHNDSERIYRLVSDNGGSITLLNTSPRFARELESSIPEIEFIVNSAWGTLESSLIVEEEVYSTQGEFATESFFELFTYPLTYGNPATIFNEPNAIALSEKTALRLFNSTDVVGKTLEWRWYSLEESVVVTGVYKDVPGNSSAQFDYVLSFNIFEKRFQDRIARGNRVSRTFMKLTDGASAETVNQKIHQHTRANYPDFHGDPYFVIAYADYYLNSEYENGKPIGGRIELIRLFIVIAILILIIACINFMNLSTARAALRTKEIGVRKTMGALRKSLIFQYLTESCMISLMAGLTALGMLFFVFPLIQRLLGQAIQPTLDPRSILAFLSIIFITGLLSGSYPALYLSRFNPIRVLKGPFFASSGDQWLRKGLVVFQFGISLILIVAVLVIYQQMQFIQNKDLGYKNEFIINFETKGMSGDKQQAFLSEARRIPGVVKASGISHALFGAQKSGANITWEGKDPEQEVWFEWGNVGYDMLELLDIELLEGRFFSKEFSNERTKVVINKATKDLIGIESSLGKKFSVGESEYEIIGVTDDFHFQSLHEQIKPTFFLLNNGWSMKLALRIQPKRINETLPKIQKLYSKFNPGFSFEYTFHDDDQREMYATEKKTTVLAKYAAGLAIFISCLGLFGLVSFVTERKSKEMGIRKMLGASTASIVKAISKDFVVPISVATILGVGASALLINGWLSQFAYRVDLKWWFFAGAVLLMFSITAITTISRIIKVIIANPINSLRDE